MNGYDQMSSDSRLLTVVYPGGKKEIKEYSFIFINILFKNKIINKIQKNIDTCDNKKMTPNL